MASGLTVAPFSNKLFFTYFLISIGVAVYLGFYSFCDRTEFDLSKISRHYRGSEEKAFDPEVVDQSQESMDEGFFFPKTYKEVLSVTHVHIFMMPLILFVLSRILTMTLLRARLKNIVYTVSFTGTALNLAGPWLIMYIAPQCAIILFISYILMGLSFPVYILLPLYEMWIKPKRSKKIVENNCM